MARPALMFTVLVLLITVFGLLMVGNASVVDALRDFGDKWHYLKAQSTWALIGVAGFLFMSKFPHQKLEKYAPFLMIITLILLVVVLIPGIGNKLLGARRWISLGFFSFQPAEIAKLTTAIYLASLLKKSQDKFAPFVITVGVLGGLVMLEPDLGTTIVIVGMSLITFFGSGGKVSKLLMFVPVLLLAVGALVIFSPYRLNRLKTYLNSSSDPQGSSYHIRQVLLSIGSGGVFGVGIGQSRQKYEFLPEVTTDSIFAVIGEEMGMVGGVAVISAFLLLGMTGLKISKNAPDQFSLNLALAITSWIIIQAFVNLSAMVALVPLTGVPLPFISYGGTSLVLLLSASGIMVNIAKSSRS